MLTALLAHILPVVLEVAVQSVQTAITVQGRAPAANVLDCVLLDIIVLLGLRAEVEVEVEVGVQSRALWGITVQREQGQPAPLENIFRMENVSFAIRVHIL